MTGLLLAALLSGFGPPGADTPEALPRMPSQHAFDSAGRPDPACPIRVEGVDGGRELYGTVFGFLPYWAGYAYLRYDLISVLACFSIEMGPAGSITSWHGFPSAFEAPVDGVHAAGGIAVITVTNFSGSGIHSILTTGKDAALATLTGVLDSNPGMDGICLDFEGVLSSDRDELTGFVDDLREVMDESHPGSHLSICTPAVDWSGAFDYDLLAGSCDALFMMCYPFHGSWSDEAGPCCPLTGWGSGPESPSNMAWSLGDYVICAPEVHEKLVIGLPYYGFEWETEEGEPHSPAVGSCATLVYSTLASRAATYGRLWDAESLTPWYRYHDGGWNQGWFDDPGSFALKYNLIIGSGFQGAGIWALGYDGSRTELWDCIETWFAAPPQGDGMTDNLEETFSLNGPSSTWHYSGTGVLHSHFYTYTVSSGPDVNWAQWFFEAADSSSGVMLEAWIPDGSDALAVYRVVHGGATDSVEVDQEALQGSWAPLGGPYCMSEGLSVILGDRTGVQGERIGFDAVRCTPAGGTGPGGQPPALLSISGGNPALSFEIACPALEERAIMLIYDCSGRLVFQRALESGAATVTGWPAEPAPAGIYTAVLRTGGILQPAPLRLVLL